MAAGRCLIVTGGFPHNLIDTRPGATTSFVAIALRLREPP